MDAQIFASAGVAAGIAAVIVAIINGFMTRRRVGAEATEIITKAAGGMVERLEKQVAERDAKIAALEADQARANTKIARLEAKILRDENAWHRERTAWRATLQTHAAWDHLAVADMAEWREGRTPARPLPEPPPLTPHTRASDFTDRYDGDVQNDSRD